MVVGGKAPEMEKLGGFQIHMSKMSRQVSFFVEKFVLALLASWKAIWLQSCPGFLVHRNF